MPPTKRTVEFARAVMAKSETATGAEDEEEEGDMVSVLCTEADVRG